MKELGFVFDIDGTLIAESDVPIGVIERPGIIDVMTFLVERQHRVAIWTAGNAQHANQIARHFCSKVYAKEGHICQVGCRKTFDFVWWGEKLSRQRKEEFGSSDVDDVYGCRWCRPYKHHCNQCSCATGHMYCVCRWVKDLRKVWKDPSPETSRFVKERTLIVENTPQKCVLNYGNTILVPTFTGRMKEYHTQLSKNFKRFIRECIAVGHRQGPHPCYEQDWWTQASSPQCIEITNRNDGSEYADNIDDVV
jgi:hypothetical protein